MHLTLLHTNDLHGHVEELAHLATMARRLRAEVEAAGGHCLLVDLGDAEERTVLEMAVTQGAAAMAYLRVAGYDLGTIGNGAPLSFGPQVIPGMAAAAGFPFMAANLLDQDGRLVPGCTPSLVREVGGVRVGFIGMAPRWEFWTWFGLQNPEPAPIVRAEMERLQAAGATVIVLLSHLGLAEDLRLLTSVRDIDLILGGHSHTTIYGGVLQGETLIAQAGDYGRFLGRVDLEIDDETGRVSGKRATLVPLDPSTEPNPAVLAEVEHQRQMVAARLQEPVGQLTADLPFDAIAESPASNLLADALRLRTGADVALVQPTHLLGGLEAGTVTLGQLYQACRSPGNPAWRTLSGAQLLALVEAGLDPQRAERATPWGRSRPNGTVAVSGFSARYDRAAPAGQRLSQAMVAGQPLQPECSYLVAGSDAEMTGLAWRDERQQSQLGFELADDDVTYEVPATLREVLEEHIRTHSPLAPPPVGRIRPA